MGQSDDRSDAAPPIPVPVPATATEQGPSSVAMAEARAPPARDAEQVRGNLGFLALEQQQLEQGGRPAASIAAPRYIAPFFAQAAQPEISEWLSSIGRLPTCVAVPVS